MIGLLLLLSGSHRAQTPPPPPVAKKMLFSLLVYCATVEALHSPQTETKAIRTRFVLLSLSPGTAAGVADSCRHWVAHGGRWIIGDSEVGRRQEGSENLWEVGRGKLNGVTPLLL